MLSAYEWTLPKINPLDDFLKIVHAYQSAGKKIVTTNGCFDLLHVGHLDFLKKARSLGDVLIVGLNSDESVRRIKGINRPLLPEHDRAAMLIALKSVDHVVVFNDLIPNNLLGAIKPNFHCKASDYTVNGLPEAEVVRSNGGEICILPSIPGYSTSKLLERILISQKQDETSVNQETPLGGRINEIVDYFLSSSNVLRQSGYQLSETIVVAADLLSDALQKGQKVLVCGNGGSAADAQHFAAELVVRFKQERRALNAISLTTDTSIVTASGNDFGFESIFSRQVNAYGFPGDVLVAISTSGKSPNILAAIREARSQGLKVIGLSGGKASPIQDLVDLCLVVPSDNTPFIQQVHTAILHVLCDQIEKSL